MASSSPLIYLIRHGEKPPKDANGDDVDGLSIRGINRAQGLRQVFGKSSHYNIGSIIVEHPKKDGSRSRPYSTIIPLAVDLGLTPNKSIDRNDADGAAQAAKAFQGPGNVLICWEHGQLAKIAEAMGVKGYAEGAFGSGIDAGSEDTGEGGEIKYPDDRFDVIWTVEAPYEEIKSVTSEGILGLDDNVPQAAL